MLYWLNFYFFTKHIWVNKLVLLDFMPNLNEKFTQKEKILSSLCVWPFDDFHLPPYYFSPLWSSLGTINNCVTNGLQSYVFQQLEGEYMVNKSLFGGWTLTFSLNAVSIQKRYRQIVIRKDLRRYLHEIKNLDQVERTSHPWWNIKRFFLTQALNAMTTLCSSGTWGSLLKCCF